MKSAKEDSLLRLQSFADSRELSKLLSDLSENATDPKTQYLAKEAAEHIKGLYNCAVKLSTEVKQLRRIVQHYREGAFNE
jgi:hypothetical protein